MNGVFARDPNPLSERNRLKIESSFTPRVRNSAIVQALINIPSYLIENGLAIHQIQEILEFARAQSGLRS